MSKILYLECNTGISGDMTVAALLDLGADEARMREVLGAIPDESFSIQVQRVKKAGLDCCDFNVVLDAEHENHDHDMEYLYGHEHHHEHEEHVHNHEHEHHHEHVHDHDHAHTHMHDHDHDHEHHHDHHHHDHDHHHAHRGPREVQAILDQLPMTEGARAIAERTFAILTAAEAKAHGVPEEEVHFHEVGAIDSIVDVVAAAVLIDDLGADQIIVGPITEGTGQVRCQHGIIPVPVPAVANIAAATGLPLKMTDRQGELVTPTGAALAAAVMTGSKLPETVTIKGIGLGAGKRAYDPPSVVRAFLLEDAAADGQGTRGEAVGPAVPGQAETVWKLEADIDDSTGEQLGFTLERLLEAGARDAHFLPVFMKKNRPAWELTVITDEAHREAMERILFRETTTIGIRRQQVGRTIMARHEESVETEFGPIRVKVCSYGDIEKRYHEYESVRAAALRSGTPFTDVFQAALKAAR
ncbi:MAG: nickel pincer cofactor biosynthesis protein LarC [Firmicutes bacterium]|nr:nickel pincer cofactor biosynthesis protein LarC [Bacillota bacterium]